MGLVETKNQTLNRSVIRSMWGDDEFEWDAVDAINQSGGILCVWDKKFLKEQVVVKANRWLCVCGKFGEKDFNRAIVVIYGPHNANDKREVWEELINLKESIALPILIMGDFNEIRNPAERKGCQNMSTTMQEFEDWINIMELMDIPLEGRQFTWRRGRSCSKLDRVLAQPQWMENFESLKLSSLKCALSDHIPLHLSSTELVNWGPKPFRCMNAWLSHPGFAKLISDEWKNMGNISMSDKLKKLKQPIRRWNKEAFGNMDENIKTLEKELETVECRLDRSSGDEVDFARYNALKARLVVWYNRRAEHWKQLSKERYLEASDKNSRYFHMLATYKKRRRNMSVIQIGRRTFKNPRRIKNEVRGFFKKLYQQENLPCILFKAELVKKIGREDAWSLESTPSRDEIREAVWDCESLKAPGPDGMHHGFIKSQWHVIGNDFTNCILEFFNSGVMARPLNMTWVTLAAKIDDALEIKDFRPISMVGSIYKVISKILSKRLRKVLPELVGESQTAFIQGRQILDGALIACEMVEWAKKKRKEVAILKLDFRKAYDSVRWVFVDQVMEKMGFGQKWRGWIMSCVSSAEMSIIINGVPTEPFKMQRGLRQGDPISSFLFVLVTEVLNCVFKEAIALGLIEGVRVGKNKVELSHLQFADDIILFCPAKLEVLTNYRRILDGFGLMSGLQINFEKSALFPINCDEEWVAIVSSMLNCPIQNLPTKYLGIPLGANPKRVSTWKPVIDRIQKKLSGWSSKVLSRAGRLVLIKAVLNSIPIYYLGLFKMPVQVAKKIIQLQSRFFWGSKEGKRCFSVEYRLAPENPLPAAYHDCWAALQWLCSHSTGNQSSNKTEPWLIDHGDFDRVFIGGDSAGGNIAHNIAMRAGEEALSGDVKLLGAILCHPYFYSSYPIGSEKSGGGVPEEKNLHRLVWKLAYPSAPGGIDNPMVNPVGPGAASLGGLGCSRMIVCVAGSKDEMRDRGVWYYEAVKKNGWKGKLELFEEEEEGHVYHVFHPESENAHKLFKRLASFLHQ